MSIFWLFFKDFVLIFFVRLVIFVCIFICILMLFDIHTSIIHIIDHTCRPQDKIQTFHFPFFYIFLPWRRVNRTKIILQWVFNAVLKSVHVKESISVHLFSLSDTWLVYGLHRSYQRYAFLRAWAYRKCRYFALCPKLRRGFLCARARVLAVWSCIPCVW